jgi:anaerobic selenocysteine-containing dehydrogenase
MSGLVANILNHLAGNIGVRGGVIPNINGSRTIDFKNNISALATAASASKIKTLLVYDTNPVFTTPKAMKTEESLRNIPFIASFSSFMDETTAMADLVLPAHTSLEDWGDDFAIRASGHAQPAKSFFQHNGIEIGSSPLQRRWRKGKDKCSGTASAITLRMHEGEL